MTTYFKTLNSKGGLQISDGYLAIRIKETIELGDYYDYSDDNLHGYQIPHIKDMPLIYNPSDTGIYLECGNLRCTEVHKPYGGDLGVYGAMIVAYGNKDIANKLNILLVEVSAEYPPANCGIEVYEANGKRTFSSSKEITLLVPELITFANRWRAVGRAWDEYGYWSTPTYERTGETLRTCNITRPYPICYTRFSKSKEPSTTDDYENGNRNTMCYLTKNNCRVDTWANFGVRPPDPYIYGRVDYGDCLRNEGQAGLNDSFAIFGIPKWR